MPQITRGLLFLVLILVSQAEIIQLLFPLDSLQGSYDVSDTGELVVFQNSSLQVWRMPFANISKNISSPMIKQFNYTFLKISPTGEFVALTSRNYGSGSVLLCLIHFLTRYLVLILSIYNDSFIVEVPPPLTSSSCASPQTAPPLVAWQDDVVFIWWPELCAITSYAGNSHYIFTSHPTSHPSPQLQLPNRTFFLMPLKISLR